MTDSQGALVLLPCEQEACGCELRTRYSERLSFSPSSPSSWRFLYFLPAAINGRARRNAGRQLREE